MEAEFPAELEEGLSWESHLSMENSSNPYGMGQADRAAWTAELDFEVPIPRPRMWRQPSISIGWVVPARSMTVTERLRWRLPASSMRPGSASPSWVPPSYAPVIRPGGRGTSFVFQMLAIQNVETLEDRGVRKVITQCPHCFNTLKNEYPQFGGDYEVIHHSQVLSDLVSQGLLRTRNGQSKTVTYHDSCYLGRHNGVYMAPRGVVASIGGINVVEMGRSGTRSFCCGAGGSQMWMEERVGKKVNIDRAEEAVATGADEIAVACPFCFVMLDDGVRELGEEESVAVRDISMILADSVFDE